MADDFPFLAHLEVLPAWERAAGHFLARGGVVMVLGAPDTGKSTLCRYLVYRAYAAGQRVALVDLDVGQSHLGPPTTLGLGLYPPRRPGDDGLFPEGLYFIGQTSPVGAILEVTVGCRVLADLALSQGVSRVVVNTSGFVQGLGALRLKRSQAELLQPALILGLQRDRELEPLLRGLGGDRRKEKAGEVSKEGRGPSPPIPTIPPQGRGSEVSTSFDNNSDSLLPYAGEEDKIISGWPLMRLAVSGRAARRAPAERRRYREERFRRYFHRARPLKLPWRSLVWEGLPWGRGVPLAPGELRQLHRALGVVPLYGEAQGRRLVLLLAAAPREHLGPSPAPWDQVHWLSWPSLHFKLVGLLDGRRRTLSLGLILPEAWDPAALALWTPLAEPASAGVHFVKVGKLHVSPQGQELDDV